MFDTFELISNDLLSNRALTLVDTTFSADLIYCPFKQSKSKMAISYSSLPFFTKTLWPHFQPWPEKFFAYPMKSLPSGWRIGTRLFRPSFRRLSIFIVSASKQQPSVRTNTINTNTQLSTVVTIRKIERCQIEHR